MDRNRDLDAVADACIAAHAAIAENGTPQMKELIRVLLHVVGIEIARTVPASQRAGLRGADGTEATDCRRHDRH